MMTASEYLDQLFQRYAFLVLCRRAIEQSVDALVHSFRHGGKLLLAGNGGSAADTMHISGELLKGFHLPRPLSAEDRAALAELYGDQGKRLGTTLQRGLPAIALPGLTSLTTAVANDMHPDLVYAQGVLALGAPGDVFFGISTSGKAVNVTEAARVAKWRGLTTIALTGKEGGDLASLCDLVILTPGVTTARIQEYHLPIYHTLCAAVEAELFGNK